MKNSTTKMFNTLPQDSGIPFSGLEKVKIESREIVEKQIKDFLFYSKNDAKGITARIILGNWGEGKTDTYTRLIKPEIEKTNDELFFLSASTLVNSYESESVLNFNKFNFNEDTRLLVHLFNSITSDLEEDTRDLPVIDSHTNPKAFLNNIWDKLLTEKKDKNIYIFIDEFEELLLEPQTLKKVVRGIKESINNKSSVFSQGNKFEGCLHFFISCTPDAYYKIQVHDDTKLIMGGVDRRIDKIKLLQIKKNEGLNYLMALLKYSYDYKLPTPLPIENLALFNTLFRVSQGNMGNLTSLFVNLFSSLQMGDVINVLNHGNLIKFLKTTHISVFGGQTSALNVTTYDNIIEYLDELELGKDCKSCKNIFNLLIGELRPIGIKELSNYISKDEISVSRYIGFINNGMKDNDKIERSIIQMAPLKDDYNYKDVESVLKKYNYVKTINNIETLVPFSETLEDFKERINFFSLNDENEIQSKIFLPVNASDIKSFSNDEITNDDMAEELKKVFKTLIKDEETFLASDALLNHVYPTPVPPDLIYFTDESEKLKLYRLITQNLSEEFEKNMFNAFLETLTKSKVFEVNIDNKINNFPIIELEDAENNTKIKTLFSVVNGDVKVKDIEKISEIINEEYSIHSAIILYNGEFTKSAYDLISIKGLGINDKYSIIDLQINPSVAKKLIFGFKSNNEKQYQKFVDKPIYSEVCKSILEDLDFKNKIRDWLKIQESKGMVINQIKLHKSPNYRIFADGLKLYLNYEGLFTPEEIHEKNEKGILKFKKYGGKGFIASDFEDSSVMISNVSYDLQKNGFLEKIDSKYKIKLNPIEIRLLEIIKNKKTVSLKNIQKYFIIKDRNDKNLGDVYLNILEYKGLIDRKGSKESTYYEIVDTEIAFEELKEKYESYKRNIESESFLLFGHYYERKQRSDNLILLDEFDDFLTKTFNEVTLSLHDENAPLNINICKKFIFQFTNYFEEAIEEASTSASNLVTGIKTEKSSLDNSFDNLADKSKKWIKISLNKENIVDYSGINSDYEDIITIYNKNYKKDDLIKEIEKIETKIKAQYGEDYKEKLIEIFGFRKKNTTKPYFNIKFYLLDEKKDLLIGKISQIQTITESIDIRFDEINSRQEELKKLLERIKSTISKENKLAYYMYKQLEKADINSDYPVKVLDENLELSALLKSTENTLDEIGEKIKLVTQYTDLIDRIQKTEKTFLKTLIITKESAIKYNQFCDLNRFENDLEKFNEEIEKYTTRYNQMDLEELEENKDKRKKIIGLLELFTKNLKLSKDSLELEWDTFQDENKKYASKLEKIIRIIVKKEKIKDKDEIKEIIEKIHKFQDCNKIKLEDTDLSSRSIENYKESLSKESYELINKYLTNDEKKLLMTLESNITGWLDYDEIKSITDNIDMETSSFEEAIQGLVEKGYLQRGFLLTI